MTQAWTIALLLALLLPGPSGAQLPAAPDAQQIMQRMKAALEPPTTRTSAVDIVLVEPGIEGRQWRALEARQNRAQGSRLALVMLRPAEIAGVAIMIQEQPDGPDVQWNYLPAVQRVRKIYPIGGFEPFLGTDFTLADLGFIDLRRRTVRLLGTDTMNGVPVYTVEEVPENRWYYGRTVNWIDQRTFLPLRRDHFTPAGDAWKSQRFENIEEIDGVATPTRIRMLDVLSGTTTEFRYSNIRYGSEIAPAAFEPEQLPNLRDHLQAVLQASGGSAAPPAGDAPAPVDQ